VRARRLVLAAFVLSGATGLVYEVVWTRLLSLTFGITVFATSAVLAAYMAGLGLGSLVVGRWIDRRADPVRVYAVLAPAGRVGGDSSPPVP
jgi:spermidine synthase